MEERTQAAELRRIHGSHPILGIRAVNALLSLGINPYEKGAAAAASKIGAAKLLTVPNFGMVARKEVETWLRDEGFLGFMTIDEVRSKIHYRETQIKKLQRELAELREMENSLR